MMDGREPEAPSNPETSANDVPAPLPRRPRRVWLRFALLGFFSLLLCWLALAYLILPRIWRHYEHQPGLEDAPKFSRTAQGIPGDPLNLGLVGTEEQIVHAMLGAGWDAADGITLRTSLRIASSVVRDKPYPDAPVSNLFLFGRKQDLAFEKPDGVSARRRHHVRFWRSEEFGRHGVPLWLGAATFDRSVGLSHRTGQITHHIGPDVDAERDGLIHDLEHSGVLAELFQVTGVGATLLGRNGGGDPYYTDGELSIGLLTLRREPGKIAHRLENPPAIQIKAQLWSAIRPLLQSLPDPSPD